MGLEQVIGEVRRDGEQRAQRILDDAQAEAQQIVAAAKDKVKAYEAERRKAAEKDAEQLRAQLQSGAEFEARKHVLAVEAELRQELRSAILDGFGGLDPDRRGQHIDKLLATAKKTIPEGTVHGAAQDEATLKDQDIYDFGGSTDIIGGIVVESKTGKNRLDLSYETLVDDMWRDVLRAEAGLFS